MKKILVLIALSFMTVSTLTAQMKDPQNWVGYEEIMGVKNGLRFRCKSDRIVCSC